MTIMIYKHSTAKSSISLIESHNATYKLQLNQFWSWMCISKLDNSHVYKKHTMKKDEYCLILQTKLRHISLVEKIALN
jgi:hypothetical protein